MRINRLVISILLLVFSGFPALAQKPVDDVVLTGAVTRLELCFKESGVSVYRFSLQIQAKNVGAHRVIISSSGAMTDLYKIANTREELGTKSFSHIGWVTAGEPPEPNNAPKKPARPFKVVVPNESIHIDVDLRAAVNGELRPGPAYLQIVAENWPHHSDQYIAKLRRAWSAYGVLWAHSLHSEPILFTVPENLRPVRCL